MDFPSLPRRRFLQVAVAGAGFLGLPASFAQMPARLPTAFGSLLALDADRADILLAFAEGSLATGNGFPPVRDTGLVVRIDEELFFTDAAIRDDFLLALDAIDLLPIAYGHFSRLRRLPLTKRRAFLDGLSSTRFDTVRAMCNGLRMVTGLVYYAHPACWQAMQYDGTHAGLPPQDSEQRVWYRQASGRRA